tara:strand:- start:45509 stop:47092 length:1584 start_codon:yes stop_codon:yes gene_type:complete
MQKWNGNLLRKFDDAIDGNASVGTTVVVRNTVGLTLAVIYDVDDTNSVQKNNPFVTDDFGRYSFFAPNGKYTIEFGDGSDDIEIVLVDNIAHGGLADLNPADGSAHNASDINNQNGGTLKDTADLSARILAAQVIDYNFADPYRLESDYIFTTTNAFGIAQTGQSLAEGGVSGDAVSGVDSVAFEGRTLMFSGQPIGLSTQILTNTPIGLIEPVRVTTGHSITKNLAIGNEDTYLFSGQAWGGQPYSTIKKGGSTGVFESVTTQVQNAKNAFDNIIYKAVTNIHGEQDGLNNNTTYAADLNEWQLDFDADIKAITGQVEDVPMYICQTASGSGYGFNGGITQLTFPTPLEQLEAHETYANVILVCPKYHLAYADHSHIKNISQRILGEYYAKAIKQGISYEPLRPNTITPVGSTIVIDFVGGVGSLVLDTSNVIAATSSGFSYSDGSGNTISSVAVTGASQVTITLSGAVGTSAVIAYAYHNGVGGADNQVAGLGDRGNLRDSNTDVSSYNSVPLYNWCVIFRKAVN